MDPVEIRASTLAARLRHALGEEPRTEAIAEGMRVEVLVSEAPDEHSALIVLDLLRTADRFGHERAADGDLIWAEFLR